MSNSEGAPGELPSRSRRVWLFQANPDRFDIDGYLATRPAHLLWFVSQYQREIAPGDLVYLWRNQGREKNVAGVVAEAEVVEAPTLRGEDPVARPFWREESARATGSAFRAQLRIIRTASPREVIRSEWCQEDPILQSLPNLRMRNATNFPVDVEQAARLAALWSRTGRDWTREESVAGLWAYKETLGKPVSRLPRSTVGQVALLIGRAVPGVYNKVMNFRALDPRDRRAGMSGGGATDRAVWAEFYDPKAAVLREHELEVEFRRVWSGAASAMARDVGAEAATLEETASALEKEEHSTLLARYTAALSLRTGRPPSTMASTRVYERDPLVVAIARQRARYRCEIEGCKHPPFYLAAGTPYCEVHHLVPLSEGGEDTIENVACLCPAHHREIHVGRDRDQLLISLTTLRLRTAAE
jgi:hypothetical protein